MPVFNRFFPQPGPQGPQLSPTLLLHAGPILAVEVSIPTALAQILASQNQVAPPPATGIALIDTGATRSCVDSKVISQLGVNPIGVITTGTAGGPVQQSLFPARFRFPGEGLDIEFSSVVGVDLAGQNVAGRNIIVLVGRDVLSHCQLIYNGPGGFFTLAY